MAAKSKSKVTDEVTLTDDGREATVAEAPATTFEERTTQAQPWLNEDGSQNVGDVVVAEPAIEDTPQE